jgi:uncharacterized membrane protein
LQPPYHPLFVHFPIAIYLLGVLLTVGYLWRREPDYDRFAYWSFFLSWIAAVVAALVGLVDRGALDYNDPRQAALDQHITQGVLFIIFNGLVLYSRFRWPNLLDTSRRWTYLALLLLGVVTLVASGWFGGKLVYEHQIGIQ